MIASIKRYTSLFSSVLFTKKERAIVFRQAWGRYISGALYKHSYTLEEKEKALEKSIQWLLFSFRKMSDGGSGTYYIVKGWTSSYPETSGYIMPTLYQYATQHPAYKKEINALLKDCADWLTEIQKPSGGWQSSYVAYDKPEVVFNTGQVIRGLLLAYEITGDKKYLESCTKACDWLCDTQEENGSWVKTAYMQQPRVYDSYVVHPMLEVWKITKNERYQQAAIKNLDWITDTQQQENGWFNNCDNTVKHNDRPILHTISYTIDGLINSGLILKTPQYIEAGKKAADHLLDIFYQDEFLHGRFNKNWEPSEYLICTGCAQISIIWSLLYELTSEEKYLHGAEKMNQQLVYIQRSCNVNNKNSEGALPGSYPIWGKYEPFAYPNWATKYFADALMQELEAQKKHQKKHQKADESYQ